MNKQKDAKLIVFPKSKSKKEFHDDSTEKSQVFYKYRKHLGKTDTVKNELKWQGESSIDTQ